MKVKSFVLALLMSACQFDGQASQQQPKPVSAIENTSQDKPSTPSVQSLKGLDLSVLSPSAKAVLLQATEEEISPCDRPETLAACVNNNTCASCGYLARSAYRMARDKSPEPTSAELSKHIAKIRDSLAAPVQSLDLNQTPSKGTGPTILVEYADFQCPHCAMFHEELMQFLPQISEKATFYFKSFPLPSHDAAEPAARAALAAGKQGKFWEYHDYLFTNQKDISADKLVSWAEALGLDKAKFEADFASPEIANQVAKDRQEGQKAGLQGTPTLFINGRRYDDNLSQEAILDAIDFAASQKK